MEGPTAHTAYEILKDFQPALAALIALTAAVLAYRGAIAKIDFDRENNQREQERQKLGLCVRLRYETEQIGNYAGRLGEGKNLAYFRKVAHSPNVKPIAEIMLRHLKTTPALEEAWQKLYQFPPNLARNIEDLRVSQQALLVLFEEPMKPDEDENDDPENVLGGHVKSFAAQAAIVESDLVSLVEKLRAQGLRHDGRRGN